MPTLAVITFVGSAATRSTGFLDCPERIRRLLTLDGREPLPERGHDVLRLLETGYAEVIERMLMALSVGPVDFAYTEGCVESIEDTSIKLRDRQPQLTDRAGSR